MQERLKTGCFKVKKIGTKDNCADLLTKHLSENDAKRHLDYMSMEVTAGRSVTAPMLKLIVNSAEAKTQRRLMYEGAREKAVERRREAESKRLERRSVKVVKRPES